MPWSPPRRPRPHGWRRGGRAHCLAPPERATAPSMGRAAILLGLALAAAGPAGAAELTADPTTYRAVVAGLVAGDHLTLAAGTYEGLILRDLAGEPGRPIVISGPTSGPRAVIGGRACCNAISIADSYHLVVRHLDVDQRGQPTDAIRAEADAAAVHHLTLEDLRLHGFADDADVAGIRTACPAWSWTIRAVRIEAPGVGLRLGEGDGRAPFVGGVLEQLLVVDPRGAALRFEDQGARPAAVPTTPAVTVVRHAVLIKSTRASEASPTVHLGRSPAVGAGASDGYEVYGNLFYENARLDQILLRADAPTILHDNLLVNSLGGAVALSAGGAVYDNTIYAAGRAVEVSAGAVPITGNAVFSSSPTPIVGGAAALDVVDTLGRAAGYVRAPGLPLGMLDLYPRAGSALVGAPHDLSAFSAHLDFDRDFDGQPKTGRVRGAYGSESGGPRWALAATIKPVDRGGDGDARVTSDASGPDAGLEDATTSAADATAAEAGLASGADAGGTGAGRAPSGCTTAGGSPTAVLALVASLLGRARRRRR